MPKRVLFGEEGFRWLYHNLKRRDFRLIEHSEIKRDIRRLGLIPTRPFRPMTAVFVYDARGYTVKVRTTYNQLARQTEDGGNGWIMILDGDVRKYTARPLNRTAHFLDRLLDKACIARQRAINRPQCTTCKKDMDIVKGPHPKQVYWLCPDGCERLGFDDPLPPEVQEHVKKYRKEQRRSDARTRVKGKKPHQRMFERAKNPPWRTTRLKNRRTSGPV